MRLIIDSHLDLAWNALSWNRDQTQTVQEIRRSEEGMNDDDARGHCTVSLPEMKRGGVAVCCGTLLVRAQRHIQPTRKIDLDVGNQEMACAIAHGQMAYYRLLAKSRQITLIRNQRELQTHWSQWQGAQNEADSLPVGLILAMEGADPIVSPSQAEQWWNDGVRAVGLAHYGKSHYAVGTGDSGPLTSDGVELLKELDRLGMILDVTHSSDPSFFQGMDLFRGPVMASHNNCRALVPGDRQFSDEQIRLLIERGAVIGVACYAWMLKKDFIIGKSRGCETSFESIVDHLDHICQLAGNTNHAAIGSDLDGGFGFEGTPGGLEKISDLQKLASILDKRGYSVLDVDKIFHGNWLRFFNCALPVAR